jgi:carbonic anhydrase
MKTFFRFKSQIFVIFLLSLISSFADDHQKSKYSDFEILQILTEGNKRFVEGKSIHPHQDLKTILENSKGQHPYAVIITCSDSRVPVEQIFDQGVGDIFVIRTAGNIIGKNEMGSIQYAVEHLGIRFVGIMGHTDCGAIKAYANGHKGDGNIKDIIAHISEEDEEKEIPEPKHEHLNQCIYANVFHGLKQINEDPFIAGISKHHGNVHVLPMIYDVNTGLVEVLNKDMKTPH